MFHDGGKVKSGVAEVQKPGFARSALRRIKPRSCEARRLAQHSWRRCGGVSLCAIRFRVKEDVRSWVFERTQVLGGCVQLLGRDVIVVVQK